jgi:DNA-binding response OmpR family regulator
VRDRDTPKVALVVDDEFLIVMEVESILVAAGYLVLGAVNLVEARQILGQHSIDIAVLDFRMGEDVIALGHELQARNVPTVFCTGSLAEEVRAVFPAARVIPKPFTGELLLGVVAAALPA